MSSLGGFEVDILIIIICILGSFIYFWAICKKCCTCLCIFIHFYTFMYIYYNFHLSLYKFGSCLFTCLFVCPFVRYVFCYVFSMDHGSAKSSQNFTKPSAYVKFGLPSCFKLFEPVHVPACMHSAWKRARDFCLLFWSVFLHFEAFPYWKWKNGGRTPDRYGQDAKWPKCVNFC